ncbi:acyl carrier protein [Pseudomonas chlororaphis]|uniref:acyl carrier protein n=1 Tax=Pseudomonas chlororaphis TaxID=587753 RepID=UPI003D123A21
MFGRQPRWSQLRPDGAERTDSLTAAELRNTVERTTGASVPMDLFVDGSSLDRVIDIVFTQVERHLYRSTHIRYRYPDGDINL